MAYVDVTVNDANTASVTMNAGHAFSTTISGTTYQFVNTTARILQPTDGIYVYSNIPIYEGTWVTTKFTKDSTDADQRFIIPNANVDISTLSVTIPVSYTHLTLPTKRIV